MSHFEKVLLHINIQVPYVPEYSLNINLYTIIPTYTRKIKLGVVIFLYIESHRANEQERSLSFGYFLEMSNDWYLIIWDLHFVFCIRNTYSIFLWWQCIFHLFRYLWSRPYKELVKYKRNIGAVLLNGTSHGTGVLLRCFPMLTISTGISMFTRILSPVPRIIPATAIPRSSFNWSHTCRCW